MKSDLADMKRSRPGIYARGAQTVETILNAAACILIEEGYSSFTIRKIADKCGFKSGNVSKHFHKKEILVETLLDDLLRPCREFVDDVLNKENMTDEDALKIIISGSFDCALQKSTANLFIEIWAMANHCPSISQKIDHFYQHSRSLIAEYVGKVNPQLSTNQAYSVAVYIHASIEGTLPILGYGKPCTRSMPLIKAIGVRNLVNLAKTIQPEELSLLAPMHLKL